MQLHKLRSLRRSFLHFHFISANHIWFISYIINTHFFHGNIWTHNWPAPSVSGFIAQLVEHGISNREVTGSNPVEVLNFFQASLGNCINCVHCDDHFFIFISFPQFIYDLLHISLTKSFLSLICFRKLWLWNPGAYWSRNKVWPNHWYLWHGFLCGPWSSWIQRGKEKKSQGSCGISTQDYQRRVHEVVPAEGMSKALNNLYLFVGCDCGMC